MYVLSVIAKHKGRKREKRGIKGEREGERKGGGREGGKEGGRVGGKERRDSGVTLRSEIPTM